MDKKQLTKLLSFMSTFDGGLYRRGSANAQFIMNMKSANLDYCEWVATTVRNVTGCSIRDRKDYNTDGFNRQPQVRVESSTHPFLTTLWDRIYIDNHKVIDLHMLELLDAEALAIIFMADGGSNLDLRNPNPHCTVSLNTKGFSEADNLALSKAIYEKLGVRTTVRKHGKYRYLGVKTADIVKFAQLVLPNMQPSFMFKFERIAPALERMGGDIVWPWQKCQESGRDAQIK